MVQQPSFLGDPVQEKKRIKRGVTLARRPDAKPVGSSRSPKVRVQSIKIISDPCNGCSRSKEIKVFPYFPPQPKLICCGMAPGMNEELDGYPFSGESGDLLRFGLREAGLDDMIDVGYVNLARCRPEGDAFGSDQWMQVEDRCISHLLNDLRPFASVPILLLGTRPAARFFGDKGARVTSKRGLWYNPNYNFSQSPFFVSRHPASILRERDPQKKAHLRSQFLNDIRRAADRVLGRERFPEVNAVIFSSPKEAESIAREINSWGEDRHIVFDIESFDAGQVPSRVDVATDPCHPDFRVRGVAVAVSGSLGYWIELMGSSPDEARPILDLIFNSDCEKCAFVGYFDESGLVVPGWVTSLRNRARDPWLGAIALDTYGMGHSLERLAVEVLKEPQPKAGVDRSRIKEMSLENVGRYGVEDACIEWRLDAIIQDRLKNRQYLWEWE